MTWDGWTIPDGYTPVNLALCRSCASQIVWCITRNDKRAPLDRDGRSHFATCPQAGNWRRGRRHDTY